METNENGVVGQHDMSPSDLNTFDTAWMDEGIVVSFSKRYPKHIEPNLLQSEPELKHVSSKCGMTYTVDPFKCCMTLTTTMKEPDLICKAKQLLQLLSVNIPAGTAFQLFNGRQSCLIKIGHQYGGLGSHFWISEEQFVERRKLLRDSREALARLTWCEIFMQDEIIVVIGRSEGVKWVKYMVIERLHCFQQASCTQDHERREESGDEGGQGYAFMNIPLVSESHEAALDLFSISFW